MKRFFVLICCLGLFLGCKKDAIHDITKYKWEFTSFTVSPALTRNGKTSKNMNDFYDKEQCQTAVVFFSNYTYSISSPDPKCNGYYNGDPSTWKKRGELILLNDHNAKHTLVLKGNQMTETTAGEENGVLYTFVRTYTAVPK